MDYTLNDSSLKSSTRYLWDKLLIKKILKTLNDFKDEEKTSKRNFTLFLRPANDNELPGSRRQ